MKKALFCIALLAGTAFALGTTFPDLTFQDNQVTITVSDIDQISTSDLPGYITIDLRNFNKLHFRKDQFQVINEQMNELTAYQALPGRLEIMPGRKVRLVVIRFKFSVTKTLARNIFRSE